MERYAVLYLDGSLNVHSENYDLERVRKELKYSVEDPESELVKVDIEILQSFTPKLVEAITQTAAERIITQVKLAEYGSEGLVDTQAVINIIEAELTLKPNPPTGEK